MSYVLIPSRVEIVSPKKGRKKCVRVRQCVTATSSADSNSQIKKPIITFIRLWMDGGVCMHFHCAARLSYHTVVDFHTRWLHGYKQHFPIVGHLSTFTVAVWTEVAS